MQKRNFKRLAQSVNERMELRYQIDKAMMAKDKFESFYYNDIEEGKLRSVTPEMLEDFDNDPAYGNKTKTDEDLVDAAFDLLYNRYPNFDSEKIVHISNIKIYTAVNKSQDNKSINNIVFQKTKIKDICVGEFFTSDINILSKIITHADRNITETDVRQKVCLTSSFKQDIAAVYEFYVDDIGVDAKKSLIGAQFDFKAKVYYPASLLIQYEIKKNLVARNEHIIFRRRYIL